MKLAVLSSLRGFKERGLGTLVPGHLSLLPNVKCGLEDSAVHMCPLH